MNIGDLVLEIDTGRMGFVDRVDKEYHGARQAFKIYQKIPRGRCIRDDQVDGIGPTKDGIQDRVLVYWSDKNYPTYVSSGKLEVISEKG